MSLPCSNPSNSRFSHGGHETKPAVIVYSSGKRYGHPTCKARNRLDDSLAKVAEHKAVCGTKSEEEYNGSATELAEYMTRVIGTITVTTNGKSQLRLDCKADSGCAGVDIDFE